MRTLALVVPSLTRGGGVPAVARFVRDAALRSGRYDLKLVSLCMASNERSSRLLLSPSTWWRGPMVTHGEWEGLPYSHVGADWAELEFQRYRSRRILTEAIGDCDVVQVVCGSPAWANTVRGTGKPVALQVATRMAVERRWQERQLSGWKGRWRKAMTVIGDRLDDQGLRGVDAIQVENPWMLKYARDIIDESHVDLRYAPPGVNTSRFSPLPERTVHANPYVLCVGRLSDPRKNIHLLLEAYSKLQREVRAEVPLVLAGFSPPPDSFWDRARVLGLSERISYHRPPTQDHLVRLYQEASVFVLTSDEEGLGVVLLEAMASGIPVVSTRSGGPDGIITDGEDGFLVNLDDARSMADRIGLLLTDSARNLRMGQAARATAERRFDAQRTGDVFVEMWDRLCDRREKTRSLSKTDMSQPKATRP